MTLVLIDTPQSRLAMYPLSLTRPVCDLRQGIITTREWWSRVANAPVFALSERYLQEVLPENDGYTCIDATVKPDWDCLAQILTLRAGALLEDEHGLIAFGTSTLPVFNQLPVWPGEVLQVKNQVRLSSSAHLFKHNAEQIFAHYQLLTEGKESAPISPTNTVLGTGGLFLHAGARVEACVINTSDGPVFIGKNALVMEGTLVRGPVAICEGAVVKMGARLYPGTTIGPFCTAGGEIKNSILTAYSNKAHDGYLGDSVIGEWCNFGAGSSNSNVKNTGGDVKMWQQATRSFEIVGIKAGLIMGDYSRCAINSSFNTGTTVGVSCNVYEGTYPNKHLPSFSWGNYGRYELDKACLDAANWKKMKGKDFTAGDRLILQHLFENRVDKITG